MVIQMIDPALREHAMSEQDFKDSEIGPIPATWSLEKFGDVFDFLPTATNSRADLSPNGDAYYIHYGDIHTKFHEHLDFKTTKPPRVLRTKCANAALIRNGDWIMADASEDFDGVGKSIEIRGLSEPDVAVSGLHTFLLREKRQLFVPGFKGYLGAAQFLKAQYLRVATGMKVYGVSKTALRELFLPVPPAKAQMEIVNILDDINAQVAALDAKLKKAKQIQEGVLQELLSGRIFLS